MFGAPISCRTPWKYNCPAHRLVVTAERALGADEATVALAERFNFGEKTIDIFLNRVAAGRAEIPPAHVRIILIDFGVDGNVLGHKPFPPSCRKVYDRIHNESGPKPTTPLP